jgi:hypothetical protein
MAKLTVGDKARRVLDFMLGMRNRRVRRALAAHGFTEADLLTGLGFLQALTTTKLDFVSTVVDPKLVGELDAWENRWFPIVDVVLRTNHPAVHEHVFRNLAQTEGAEVIISVSTFLDRIEAISKAANDGGLGAEGRAARKLLEKRGLNESVVATARELLAQVGKLEPLDEQPDVVEATEEAEQNLWNWYLEWSGIARVAIRDRRLLRSLGFLRVVRGAAGEEEEVVTDEELVNEPPAIGSPVSTPPVTEPA